MFPDRFLFGFHSVTTSPLLPDCMPRRKHPIYFQAHRECKYTNISKICKTSTQLCAISQKYLPLQDNKRHFAVMTIEDIALQMTPGIGVKGAVHLLGIFGDARGIFAAAPEELAMKAALREDIIRNIVHRKGFAAAEKELGYCRRNSISAIASTDPEFPALLREIPDYPHVLYLKGNAAALSARCVAMVGTRRATPYGQTMCNRLVEGLAAQVPGLCIVSGLAFGIDVAAQVHFFTKRCIGNCTKYADEYKN